MQIQLKQPEIISALKQYLTAQGIAIVGKTVKISFTAGRKESGTSVDISIEDNDFPMLTVEPVKAPTLTVVPTPVEAAAEVPVEGAPARSLFS